MTHTTVTVSPFDVFDVKPAVVVNAMFKPSMRRGLYDIEFKLDACHADSVLHMLNGVYRVAEDVVSVAVGDVICLDGLRYVVLGDGYHELTSDEEGLYEGLDIIGKLKFVYSHSADYRLADLVHSTRYPASESCVDDEQAELDAEYGDCE